MSLCIITPRLPPSLDGVGDYVYMLWRAFNCPKDWTFLVLDGAEASREKFQGCRIEMLPQSESKLIDLLNDRDIQKILVQYVGYGYSNDGAPRWLCSGLRGWRSQRPERRLFVLFHESWPHPRIWQRTYWTVRHQIRCVRTLVDCADASATNNEASRQDLLSLGTKRAVRIIPNGTTMDVSPCPEVDFSSMYAFGKESTRRRALQSHGAVLPALLNSGAVSKLILAGESSNGSDPIAEISDSSRVERVYNFNRDEIPDSLKSCGLALMHTQSTFLLKSSSFQLAAALGQVPIALEEKDPGLFIRRNEHYLSYERGNSAELIALLKDHDLLASIRRNLLLLAENELNWSRIAAQWADLMSGTP